MEKSLDRRVVRTRQLLQDALFKLILEQGYDSIRVQDITEAANLGRATFYVHYADKEALLMAAIVGIRDELEGIIKQTPNESILPGFLALFQHAEEHPSFYRVVFDHVGGRQYITKVIIDKVVKSLTLKNLKSEVPVEFKAHYIVGAVLQLLDWWLANDEPHSIEIMESMLLKMLQQGLPA